MAFNETQNKEIVNSLVDDLKLNPITDSLPKVVLPTIQPVYEARQKLIFARAASVTTSGASSTIFTSSNTKDTYITNICFSFVKDATCDCADSVVNINAIVNGINTAILSMPIITLTAERGQITCSFPWPGLRIDRNLTCVLASPTFTVGKFARTANVQGYEV